jgi:hypothetical protein
MKWISVEDGLPEDDEIVLIYAPNSKWKFYTGDYLHRQVRDCEVGWWITTDHLKHPWEKGLSWLGDVTHWMRIEEPTSEANHEE